MPIACAHTDTIRKDVKPGSDVCKACVELDQEWTALRVCQTCGHVGCCETSKGKHAKKHHEETGHPIIKPLKDEEWTWCYRDNNYIENA